MERKSLATSLAALAAILVAIAASTLLYYLPRYSPAYTPSRLIPRGTNALVPGMLLFNPANSNLQFTIMAVTNSYEFDDGTIGPAVKFIGTNKFDPGTWVPADRFSNVLIEN